MRSGDISTIFQETMVISSIQCPECPCPGAGPQPAPAHQPRCPRNVGSHHASHHHQHQRCGHTTVDINDENNCGLQRSSSTLISPYKIWSMSFLAGVVVGYLVAAAPGPFTRCPSPCPEMESGPARGHPGHLAAVHRALSSVFRSCAMCDRLAALF